jgi:hypothetical protein
MEGLFFPALRELVGDFRVNGSVSAYVNRGRTQVPPGIVFEYFANVDIALTLAVWKIHRPR